MTAIRVDAFLADAVTESGGRLNALGAGFNRVRVPELPATLGRIGLGLLLRASGSADTVTVDLRLEDPRGNECALGIDADAPDKLVARLEAQVGFAPPASASDGDWGVSERIRGIAVNLDGLVVTLPGPYRFVIGIDGRDAKIVSFAVER